MPSDDPWRGKASAVEFDLTPSLGVPLAGERVPRRASQVDGSLCCSALLLEDDAHRLVIVSCDLLYPGQHLVGVLERLRGEGLMDSFGVFASHSHNAPATDPTKPELGGIDRGYLDEILGRVESSIRGLCTGRTVEVSMTAGSQPSHLGVNRRLYRPIVVTRRGVQIRTVVSGANPKGPLDERVSVVVLRDAADDSPIAVVWSYACHPVGYPHRANVTPHYVGVVRDRLRSLFGNLDLPILFLQGFSGDTRPNHATTNAAKNRGWRRLLMGPSYSSFSPEGYEQWTEELAGQVGRLALTRSDPVLGEGIEIQTHTMPRTDFLLGSPGRSPVAFKSFRFGRDLRIVGVSAEVVSEYAHWVRSFVHERQVIPAGCMDDVVGYVPTEKMLREGGYEGGGFCESFSARAVAPGVESAVKRGFRAVCS